MRTFVRIICAAVLFLLTAPVAFAQSSQPPPPPGITLKPNTGPAGSAFTINWSNFRTSCPTTVFYWDTQTTRLAQRETSASGSVTVTVPADAAPKGHLVVATTTGGDCSSVTVRATFTVTTPPTTPVTSDPVTPSVPVTPPSNPGSSAPPITRPDPKKPPLSPSVPASTTTPPPSSTDTPPTTVDTPTSSTPPADGALVLDHPSIGPGDPLSASGHGCTPGAPVTLTSGHDQVGATTAGADGTFTSPVAFTRIEAGRHEVTATCGVVLTGSVEQIVTSSTGGHSGTMIVLVFFVLAGIAVLRFN